MPMSLFTMADRRKKAVTYGRSARYTAPQKLPDDASSPERPRKKTSIQYGTAQSPGAILATGNRLSSTRAIRQKSPVSENIFDVPSNDEPTPQRVAPPKRKAPSRKDVVDEFDFPASEDELPQTGRKLGRIANPLRKPEPAHPVVYIPKKKLSGRRQMEIPSSDDPLQASTLPATRRGTTPQATQKLTNAAQSQTTTRPAMKPNTRSRATTPATGIVVPQKAASSTTTLSAKKVSSKRAVSMSHNSDVFDVPSTDDDTPARPRQAPISRAKVVPTVPKSQAPPSPAPSDDSDVSTASNKRKRRASASSSVTSKPILRAPRKREAPILQRDRKYQKKEDGISPRHDLSVPSQLLLPTTADLGEPAKHKRVRTRLPADHGPARSKLMKGQSSPATLHSMLAVRSLTKPSPALEVPENLPGEDETMYEIPEVETSLVRTTESTIPGSVTPRQRALFSNLLGDSSDSTISMPSISKLRLTERRPGSATTALNRSSSDIPQSAHSQKGRLIDMLKQAAPSSDEESESDEETEEDITEIPAVSAPTKPATDGSSASQAATGQMEVESDSAINSQASQVAIHPHSGAKITYAQQRSILEETNFEDGLMMAMDIDDSMGLEPVNRQVSVSDDGEDLAQVRGIHELRRQGQQYKFQSEASASIDDISEKGGLNPSQRRSAIMEFATRMADKSYIGQLLESSLTASLLRSIVPTGEIIFDFASAVAVQFVLQTRPGYAVLDQIYQSSTLTMVKNLLVSDFSNLDILRIAKDRKTNMSLSARETVAEFRTVILVSVWPAEKPEKVTPQLVALKVLESLTVGLRKAGITDMMVDEDIVTKLLDAVSFSSQRLKASKATAQDHSTLAMTISILEALSISHDKQVTWSNEILRRLADMMPIFFETSSASPIRLVMRLCMNLTNNKPKACQLFAWPSFVLPLLRSVNHKFTLLAGNLEEELRNEVLEDLILSLGAMINLAEYSDQARESVVRDGDGLVRELVGIFLEGSARAEQVRFHFILLAKTSAYTP
jgi:hypothetical protein